MGSACQRAEGKNSTKIHAESAAGAESAKNETEDLKNTLTFQKQDWIEENNQNIREDYQIGKVLGTGAFGEVRVCTHRKSNVK